jgi:hypothetical protein
MLSVLENKNHEAPGFTKRTTVALLYPYTL